MLARPQSKMTVALVALSIGLALVSVTAAISGLASSGWAGTLIWVLWLVGAIPLAIAGFNAICDRFLLQGRLRRTAESVEERYWPAVERELAIQFQLNGKRYANGAVHANGRPEVEPLAPPTIPADPLQQPAMQRSRYRWWVGQ